MRCLVLVASASILATSALGATVSNPGWLSSTEMSVKRDAAENAYVEAKMEDYLSTMALGQRDDSQQEDVVERALLRREPALYKREPTLYKREPALYKREPALYKREPALYKREPALYKREPALYKREPALYKREPALYKRDSADDSEQEDVVERALFKREPALYKREPALFKREPRNLRREPLVKREPARIKREAEMAGMMKREPGVFKREPLDRREPALFKREPRVTDLTKMFKREPLVKRAPNLIRRFDRRGSTEESISDGVMLDSIPEEAENSAAAKREPALLKREAERDALLKYYGTWEERDGIHLTGAWPVYLDEVDGSSENYDKRYLEIVPYHFKREAHWPIPHASEE